jgi:hypothetical protein
MQVPLNTQTVADRQQTEAGTREVSSDLASRRLGMVNALFWQARRELGRD